MRKPPKPLLPLFIAVALLAGACGSDETGQTANDLDELARSIYDGPCRESEGESLTIYSGRSEDLIEPVLDAFTCATGIETATNFGDPTDLALLLSEEGDRTPADVFLSKSPGAVGFLAEKGLLRTLDQDLLDLVDPGNRAGSGEWVGLSGRERVLVYNIDTVTPEELPDSIFELTEERFRGRVAIPATNGSFLDWFTVFRASEGDDVAIEWLEGMVGNDAIVTESNRPTVDAVGRGEIDFGLVNHYYNFQEAEALGEDHRALNHVFAPGDIGSLLIITAGGITASSEKVESATALLEFMLSEGAQRYFTDETLEYPLAAGVEPAAQLPPLGDSDGAFDVRFDSLGEGLTRTVAIIEESGLTG